MSESIDSSKNARVIGSERDPKVMYTEVDSKEYKCEMDLFDRWQSFAAELLRLSLLGIAIFGFFYQHVFSTVSASSPAIETTKLLSKLSVSCFAVSAVCALFYRYGCTEAMMHYLRGVRTPLARKSELEARNWWLSRCLAFKILSAASLGMGAVFAAIAIFRLL